MLHILCACNHPEILDIMDRLVSKQDGWRSSKVDTFPKLVDLLKQQTFDLILLGAGFGDTERVAIEQQLTEQGQQTKVVNHFGGGSGLLYSEISLALAQN